MQVLPPRAGNRRDTLLNYEVESPVLRHSTTTISRHGQIIKCPLESKI